MARVYHELARSGSFAANVKTITRVTISDSALSQRAFSIGWKLIDEILPAVLRPLADVVRHRRRLPPRLPPAGLRRHPFQSAQHPGHQRRAIKNRCSKGSGVPAFAHLLGVVLVELGLHQPLAAAFGWQGEGELTLARKLLARQSLPDRSLILADRLFGIPSLMWELMPLLEKSAGAVLFRVKSNLKTTRIRQLSDGSWLVSIPVIKPGTRRKSGPCSCAKSTPKSTMKVGPSPWLCGFGPACSMKKNTPPPPSSSSMPHAGRKSCFSANSKATFTGATIC